MINTWIFYGTDKEGIKTVHYIKQCKKPEMTSEYKNMRQRLDFDKYYTIGYMTNKAWNKDNQFIKIAL
jgi:hypothetical protein|tara:strand:- start:230 stop:433 length:204 start_codon:yes stop_codon:yes gene_type:complete